MEIKTKHEKYKDFATRKQLIAQGLIPTSEGVDLWTNQYMSKVATYYDTKKAVKLDTVYIWKNYYYKDDLTVVEIAAVDQLGNTLFAKPVKPDKRWLADHADGWINEEHY